MPRWRRRHWDHFRDCRAAASAFAAEDADGEWVELLKEAAPSPPNRKVKGVRLRIIDIVNLDPHHVAGLPRPAGVGTLFLAYGRAIGTLRGFALNVEVLIGARHAGIAKYGAHGRCVLLGSN